jgi:hypothetical protein
MVQSSDPQVVGAVSRWVKETGELLQQVQRLLEGAEIDPSGIALSPKDLLPRVRECRAQLPCADSIRAWVDSMCPGR